MVRNEYDKMYYKIKDVSELLNVPTSTLRFWEQEFPECKPRRSSTNIRYYTSKEIETLQIIHYLLKVKGLRIDAAKEQMRLNHKNISKKVEIISTLENTKYELEQILKALSRRNKEV